MAEATTALDAAYRAVVWIGYAGLVGALAVLLVMWPDGVRQRRLALVALGGSTLLALATVGWLVARLLVGGDPALPRVEGAAAITRLAVLAAVGGFFTDLFDGPVRGRRRVAAAVAVVALTATVLVGAAGGPPGQGAAALTGDVFVAVAATVCGACLVLAAVVVPGDAWGDVPHLRSQLGETGPTAVGAAALAGAVHAIAVERSAEPAPGPLPPLVVLLVLLALTVGAVLGVGRLLRTAQGRAPALVEVPPAPEPSAAPVVEWFEPVRVARRPAVEVYEGPRRTTPAGTSSARPGDQPRTIVLPDTAAAREQRTAGATAVEADERPVEVAAREPLEPQKRPVEVAAGAQEEAQEQPVEVVAAADEEAQEQPVEVAAAAQEETREQPVGTGTAALEPHERPAAAAVAAFTAAPARTRRLAPPAARALRARRVAGLGRLVLPDHDEPAPVTRTVRVAGTADPLVLVLPESRSSAQGRG